MKKLAIIFIGLFAMTFAFNTVNAQNAIGTADTKATIIQPIAIAWVADLNFGNIIGTTAGGTVTIATDDGKTGTPALLPGVAMTGTVTAAEFTVSGEEDATYSITVPAAFVVTKAGGADMTVSSFVTTPTPTGTLTGGSQTLNVGATITVNGNQDPGLYQNTTGGLAITVAYN